MSDMPNYGLDGLLTDDQINDVADYVVQISSAATGATADAAAAARGQVVFAAQCVSCHGATGAGDPNQGAPSLIDDVWLYGGSREDIRNQIVQGRGGVMPAWEGVYDDNTIRALAIYVYALGGGQPDPVPQPIVAPAPASEAPNAQTPLR
jgi:cytochrome c oxidase cbb3-type subunit 3